MRRAPEASISHYGEGVWGAQAVAAAVSVAMVDGSWQEILDAALAPIPEDSWLYYNMTQSLRLVEEAHGDLLEWWMPVHDLLRSSQWATTAEAVPSAFCALAQCHDDFRSGVVLAGNFGRDADTIGAVAGAILGAKYGIDAIPERWMQKVRYPSGTCLQFTRGIDIVDIGKQLAQLV